MASSHKEKLDTPFKDNVAKPWGGLQAPAPQSKGGSSGGKK